VDITVGPSRVGPASGCGYDGRDYPATMEGSVEIVDARGNRVTLNGAIGFEERGAVSAILATNLSK
jgi:hypothetical protein